MTRIARWLSIVLGAIVLWAAVSDNPAVWPVRNTLEYHVTRSWWNIAGEPYAGKTGDVVGKVAAISGRGVENAVVVLSEWDGRIHAIVAT